MVSIHAPLRGATPAVPRFLWLAWFQSTPLCEGRHEHPGFARAHVHVSIHAPLRGATESSPSVIAPDTFQSTPLCEGRRLSDCVGLDHGPFQSTPLCEGRPRTSTVLCTTASFNPRPSARGDYRELLCLAGGSGFNPRPSARGDTICKRPVLPAEVSIHAPLRGATVRVSTVTPSAVFQSTPLCEGRRMQRGC